MTIDISREKHKIMHLAPFLIILCFASMIPHSISMNWVKFLWCAGSDRNTCSGSALKAQYDEMQKANCLKCDKYFHCQGNRQIA